MNEGKRPQAPLIRAKAKHVELSNSGLEVWLYDEASADTIRANGLWKKLVDGGKTDGHLVGYSLRQDDSLSIDVAVGAPLSAKELGPSRWLEPQHALLRAPSGRIAVESNDSCRVSEEAEDSTDSGAVVVVPPGDYRVILYRVDHEALQREGIEWTGAQEVVLLTPGGIKRDDVAGLLPFALPADTGWVGRITVKGNTATGLVWFDDYWDTYFANIDGSTATALGLRPGRYLRTTVPATGLTLVTVFAKDWESGATLKAPAGPKPEEFGFGAITTPERWGEAEAFFARRVTATTRVEDEQRKQWLEATFEVFDAEPATVATRSPAGALYAGPSRSYHESVLADKDYFDGDDLALCMKLDARVEGVSFAERIDLPEAVAKLDAAMAGLKLEPLGDFSFELPAGGEPREFTVRVWTGARDHFAAAWAAVDSFEVFFFSRVGSDWWLTGTVDEDDAERISSARPRISMRGTDEVSIADLRDLHLERLAGAGTAASIPADLTGFARLYDDYLDAAVG